MRARWIVLLLAVITLVIGLLAWTATTCIGPGDSDARVEREAARAKGAEHPTNAPSPSVELETPASMVDRPVEVESRDSALPISPPIESAPGAALCVVSGRVIDERDRPLAGVAVRLQAYRAWAADVDASPLSSYPNRRGFETATGADGSFRFDVSPPSHQTTFLTIEPDVFHDWAQMYFSSTRARSRPALTAREHDVGAIRLVAAGAIRGRVRDSSGRPVSGVRLSVGDHRDSTLATNSESAFDGTYTIGHVKGEGVRVHAKCDGFLSQTGEPVQVAVSQFTDDIDFVLEEAPTLRGVVVDELGVPLEGVMLQCFPTSSGEGALAKSAVDGSFTIHLPQNEAYTLEAARDGFDPYPARRKSVVHAPGASDIRIELRRAMTWALRVVDDESAAPIELFSVALLRDTSRYGRGGVSVSQDPDHMESHANGRVDIAWRPGTDTLVIVAPDRAQEVVDLDPAEIRDELIVVKLKRGATLDGRVLCGSVPARGAEVCLEPGYIGDDDGQLDGTASRRRFHVDARRIKRTLTDGGGSFHFGGLSPGRYRIVARTASERIHASDPFVLESREHKDVGDLELSPVATIAGSVLVPPGRSATGLTIYLDAWNSAERVVTSTDGTFRFAGLPPGAHRLMLAPESGAIADPAPLDVVARAGEETRVVYDVRDRGTCEVALTILSGSRPIANREVTLVLPGSPERNARLGKTDAQGRVAGWARAGVEAYVEIMTDSWSLIRHPTARVQLDLDQRVEVVVDYAFGELVLALPALFELPEQGRAIVTLSRGSRVQLALALELERTLGVGTDAFVDRDGRKLHFTTVPAGGYDIELFVADKEFDLTWLHVESVTGLDDRSRPRRWTASAVIETGKRADVMVR